MAPQGYHVVRSHYRRNPRPGSKKMSGWTIAALVAGVWLWGQVFGFSDTSGEQPVRPQPSVSAPAAP
ncbi:MULTISPECIES: hypothetical protein [Streptomyces]|uniref:Class F sortase n=1 Tax=Streptomyces lycii TaxID=2654337 RepID=A0ABQ7FGG1_9ACTN|nr:MULTISPECIES: hypothetical protein [Streptomyces]KAF4407997.1 hypothetical protein GCU69_16625 [Streptomyces lycii]PGH51501.1 hypothetical protein CRI70_06400 [Streptomyces sp. Ru87]